jgi:hypothetical protein
MIGISFLAGMLLNKLGSGGGKKQAPPIGSGGGVSFAPQMSTGADVGGGILGIDDVMKKRGRKMQNEMLVNFLSELLASRGGGPNA